MAFTFTLVSQSKKTPEIAFSFAITEPFTVPQSFIQGAYETTSVAFTVAVSSK